MHKECKQCLFPPLSRLTMGGNYLICSLALFFSLTSVSAIQKLNSIKDLKKIDVGHSVPQHSLVLLHWFANNIEIDNNDAIPLTFEPNRGDYGTHHYGNYEGLLDAPPQGRVKYRYYTLGNLNPNNNQDNAMVLPSYVTQGLRNLMEYEERNRDRIVFRVREENTIGIAGWQPWQTIDQVYITQHYEALQGQGTRYDRAHTYRITTNLLREIREFSMGEDQRNSLEELRDQFGRNIDDFHMRYLEDTWGEFACLGLLLFIVIRHRHSSDKPVNKSSPDPVAYNLPVKIQKNKPNHSVVKIPENRPNHSVVNIPENWQNHLEETGQRGRMKLEVKVASRGKASMYWKNLPEDLLNRDVMVVLFKNNNDQETSRIYKSVGDRASGRFDTSVPLNPGLQVRLHKTKRWCFFWTIVGEEICRGREFHNPKEIPVPIRDYGAGLQLFVEDGKACARLYVRKTFTDWTLLFRDSWVGFYSSTTKATHEYESWKWQWVIKFSKNADLEGRSYDVYEYRSSMAIAPGVQARFILNDVEDACTPAW